MSQLRAALHVILTTSDSAHTMLFGHRPGRIRNLHVVYKLNITYLFPAMRGTHCIPPRST